MHYKGRDLGPHTGRFAFHRADATEGFMAVVTPLATFLHIPKCGGSWVRQVLRAVGLPITITRGGVHECAATEGRFVFTFVRHPLTWYPSFWAYRHAVAAAQGGLVDVHLRETAERLDEAIDECLVDDTGRPRSFTGFVEQCLRRHPGFLSAKYELYTPHAVFVGRQEALVEDLITALRLARVVFDPAVVRRTPRVNERFPAFVAEYSPGMAALLLETEAEAVSKFYDGAAAGGPSNWNFWLYAT